MSKPAPWTCPFCSRDVLIDDYSLLRESLEVERKAVEPGIIDIVVIICPNPQCHLYSLTVVQSRLITRRSEGARGQVHTERERGEVIRKWHLVPPSSAKVFPNYVPAQVRSDYEEACAITDISPRAAATLARRALQGMIRDYWGVEVRSHRLADEIQAIKDRVDSDVWQAIDAVRRVGNIGAHMEQDVNIIIDVDAGETSKLTALIELLIREWYINRETRRKALTEIAAIADAKDAARKA